MTSLINERFGRLIVLEAAEPGRQRARHWKCRCDCGNEIIFLESRLLDGRVSSCGRDCDIGLHVTHGQTGSPEYMAWANMIQRCTNPNFRYFDRYGGRGISVCDRWRNSFEAFYADMGPRPSADYSVERKELNGNYEPFNCIWATQDVQMNNTSRNVLHEHDGQTLTQSQWAVKSGVGVNTIRARLRAGMSFEEAIVPGRKIVEYEYDGRSQTLQEWADEYGMPYHCLHRRLTKQKLSLHEALTRPLARILPKKADSK